MDDDFDYFTFGHAPPPPPPPLECELIELMINCRKEARRLLSAREAVDAARSSLAARTESACARLAAFVVEVKNQIDEVFENVTRIARKLCGERLKALESQSDELEAASAQLAAGAHMHACVYVYTTWCVRMWLNVTALA